MIWWRPEGVKADPLWLNITLQLATGVLTVAFWARWQAQTHYARLMDGSLDPMYVRIMSTHWLRVALIRRPNLTTVVRDKMKQEGLITGQEHVVGRLQKLNLSESQQRDAVNYEHGRVVLFHKRSRGGFRPGEQWEVPRRDQDGTVIVQRHGQEKTAGSGRSNGKESQFYPSMAQNIWWNLSDQRLRPGG